MSSDPEPPTDPFTPFETKMRGAGLPDVAIRTFHRHYERLLAGDTGEIPGSEALPVTGLPSAADLGPYAKAGREALDRTIVLKLNGGLGTSMGLARPKSMIEVRDGLTFLDIIARQVLALREETGARLPLVLMDSFATREPTLEALSAYPDLASDVPLDFLQHRVPKVRADDLTPVRWPDNPALEWCPPGHGDLYPALVSRGMLEQLLERDYRYAFVSNCDNLGAGLEPRILGWLAEERHPFVMEVTRRTAADRKGGHLARSPEGGFMLREAAQCPEGEEDEFQDIDRYRYFNTNNLWLDLEALASQLERDGGVLPLPLIRNVKHVDPKRPDSPRVYQLETAMGAAISAFEDSRAVEVDRRRFAPVKKTPDLLLLWSDAFTVDDRWHVVPSGPFAERERPLPSIDLDEAHFKLFEQLRARFPHGAPSLRKCTSLQVSGDVQFGRDVTCVGDVSVIHDGSDPLVIPDGAELGD